MSYPAPEYMERIWEAKRQWHAAQRALPFAEKIKIVVNLQRRQREVNEIKRAMGLPTTPGYVWGEGPYA